MGWGNKRIRQQKEDNIIKLMRESQMVGEEQVLKGHNIKAQQVYKNCPRK